jgi:hypothetical protein
VRLVDVAELDGEGRMGTEWVTANLVVIIAIVVIVIEPGAVIWLLQQVSHV